MSRETIFALSSGLGRAAVAVIRLSGPRVPAVVASLCGRMPRPRTAALMALRLPGSGEMLDRGLVLWMPGPHSFTGEDCAEFQVHGGRAVVAGVLEALSMQEGCRIAEPGEFTRRAFENGKMDLTAVEGLADLIDAETRAQRRQALRQLGGALGAKAEEWRARLLQASALVEAEIDFSDEADVSATSLTEVQALVEPLRAAMAEVLARDGRRGERLRDGFVVVVAGPPNAGKSTLINALAQREVAIVSPYPGTTRDPIEVHLDLDGLPVVLIDTAGIRDSDDPIEREGVARARERAGRADLVLWLEAADGSSAGELGVPGGADILRLATKIDLVATRPRCDIALSAATGVGLDPLLEAIARAAREGLVGSEGALVTRARHREALGKAKAALDRICAAPAGTLLELIAEDLRIAAGALGRIVGLIGAEEVLDEIFARFCIGK